MHRFLIPGQPHLPVAGKVKVYEAVTEAGAFMVAVNVPGAASLNTIVPAADVEPTPKVRSAPLDYRIVFYCCSSGCSPYFGVR